MGGDSALIKKEEKEKEKTERIRVVGTDDCETEPRCLGNPPNTADVNNVIYRRHLEKIGAGVCLILLPLLLRCSP